LVGDYGDYQVDPRAHVKTTKNRTIVVAGEQYWQALAYKEYIGWLQTVYLSQSAIWGLIYS
jgi:hypothetical protein